MKHCLNIPSHARTALAVLDKAKHEAWIVGGFVRDSLRGVEAHDVDIATDACWESVKDAFQRNGFAVHETGTKHGTVTAVVHGHPVEITTYRQEGAYSDARHPDSVTFVKDVQLDLARRDFTMNAIAYHPDKGFVDPFGGREDIENKIIRCVGNPSTRFAEDALRIMRAARFCAQLGFGIHPDTLSAMHAHAHSLSRVACERLQEEMRKFLLGPHVQFALLVSLPVVHSVIPELEHCTETLQIPFRHQCQITQRIAASVAYAPQNEAARYAALFLSAASCGEGKGVPLSEALRHALRRLRVRRSTAEQAELLANLAQERTAPTKKDLHALAVQAHGSADAVRFALGVQEALARTQEAGAGPELQRIHACQDILERLVQQGEPFCVKDLKVTGSDLVAAGVPKGPCIGQALTALLWACVNSEVKNSADELLSHLRFLKLVR